LNNRIVRRAGFILAGTAVSATNIAVAAMDTGTDAIRAAVGVCKIDAARRYDRARLLTQNSSAVS
jgi:hypothetical protein